MKEKFETWAIVELFGHSKIAGKVAEQQIAGGTFLRVDVPDLDGQVGFTRFYGASAIYSITPTSEEIANCAAEAMQTQPITVYGIVLPERQLEASTCPFDTVSDEVYYSGGDDDEEALF